MKTDPTMAEVYRVREEIAKENDYDIERILESVHREARAIAAEQARKSAGRLLPSKPVPSSPSGVVPRA